ncbi:MAG: trypsin-like serine protease [Candidatus Aminicenantes bacterium]|nr:trypsin-like serine protease [Candidatus Aminicenantes bacterium]
MKILRRLPLAALVFPLIVPGLLASCGAEAPAPEEATANKGPATSDTAAVEPSLQALSPAALIEDERNTIDIVKRTKLSVVYVTNIQLVRDMFFRTEEAVPRGSGSGFVWDRSGHIVTNAHVIDEGDIFNITLPDQQQRRARLVGKEPNKDIAVLKVEGDLSGLSPLRVGSSRALEVGQKVVAIGNPFGFDHTVTTGIVSALGRSIKGFGGLTIRDMIQTDASINPGNSGGPLLNSAGELVGMNTVIISPSGASSGIGFAVPVDVINKIVPQIIEHGRVIRPGLGVSLLSDEYARRLRIEGVVLFEVPAGSAAYQAGLRGISRDRAGRLALGDVIKSIDGTRVRSYDDFYNTLDNYKIGDTVALTVERDGRERRVSVTLMRLD